MRKKIIYFLIALIGTVGFNSCGTQSRTGTTTGTTDTSGTNVGTTTGTTTGTTGTRTGTNNQTTTRTTTTGTTTGTTTSTNQDYNRSAQTQTGTMQAENTRGQQTSQFQLREDTEYTYGNENYRFSPDKDDRINISRTENGQETPYGNMRRMGDDGYYMINTTSSTGEEETSFGRFDDQGNFTIYRYDRDRDTVFEESYRPSANPSNTSGNRRNK